MPDDTGLPGVYHAIFPFVKKKLFCEKIVLILKSFFYHAPHRYDEQADCQFAFGVAFMRDRPHLLFVFSSVEYAIYVLREGECAHMTCNQSKPNT